MTTHPRNSVLTTRHLLLILILGVAALLRFYNLLQIEHNVDHAYPVWEALRILDHRELFLTGQWTWLPVAHPALTGYLYAPLLALTRSIVAVYVFVIALNTLAVYLTYRAILPLLGQTAALVAAAFMAVNPWVIEYSRYSWPPALLPFFMSAIAWLLWGVLAGAAKHPGRRLFLALVMLALLLQTTLLAWFALLQAGILLVIFYRRLPWRGLAAGVAVLLVTMGLYAAGLYAQKVRVEAQFEVFRRLPGITQLKPDALQHAARFVTGADYDRARGYHAAIPAEDVLRRQIFSGVFVGYGEILLAIGIGSALFYLVRSTTGRIAIHPDHARIKATLLMLLVWFFVPVLVMSYNSSLVHPYYLLVTLPAGFALAGWGIDSLLKSQARPVGLFLLLLLLPFGVLMGINSTRYYQETALTPGAEGLGALPVAWGVQLGERINAHLPASGIVFADVDEWTLNSLAGRTFPVYRVLPTTATRLIPAAGALVVRLYLPGETPDNPLLQTERADTLSLNDGSVIVLDRMLPLNDLPDDSTAYPVNGETWLMLLGYHIQQDNRAVSLDTTWRVMADTTEIADYIFTPTAHVFKADGERALIADGTAVPSFVWRTGDVLMQRIEFTLPDAGDYSVRIGHYDGTRQKGLIFILPDGTYTDLIPLPDTINAGN